jgi:hypothetical protein
MGAWKASGRIEMKIIIESSDGTEKLTECEILLIGFGITVDAILVQYGYKNADLCVKVLERFRLEKGEAANSIWVKPA